LPNGRSIDAILAENETLKQQINGLTTENKDAKQQIKKLNIENETSKGQINVLNEERSFVSRHISNKTIRKILGWIFGILAIIGTISTLFWILSFIPI